MTADEIADPANVDIVLFAISIKNDAIPAVSLPDVPVSIGVVYSRGMK